MLVVVAQSGRWVFKAQLRTKPLQICLFQLARTRVKDKAGGCASIPDGLRSRQPLCAPPSTQLPREKTFSLH